MLKKIILGILLLLSEIAMGNETGMSDYTFIEQILKNEKQSVNRIKLTQKDSLVKVPFVIFPQFELQKEDFNAINELRVYSNDKEGIVISDVEGQYWKCEYKLENSNSKKFIHNVKLFIDENSATILYEGVDYIFFKLYKKGNLYWVKVVYYPNKYIIKIVKEKDLKQPTSNVNLVLDKLEFDSNKATLKEGSKGEIHRIVNHLNKYPDGMVEIQGHTDSSGKVKANLLLSQKRAETVRIKLIELNINPNRLKAQGYGDSLPIASNKTEEGKRKNRRVELKFL